MKKKSAFESWFVKQFGPRPYRDKGSDDALRSIIHAGAVARERMLRREGWDNDRIAALKAWTAMDSRKGLT